MFRAGDAEVDDAGAAGGQHDVRRLEVPVDQAGRVDVRSVDASDTARLASPASSRGPPARRLIQCGPGEVLGGDPGTSALGLRAQDPCDALAADGLRGVGLAQEPLREMSVVREFGTQHLDGRARPALSIPKYTLPMPPSPSTPVRRYGPSRIGSPMTEREHGVGSLSRSERYGRLLRTRTTVGRRAVGPQRDQAVLLEADQEARRRQGAESVQTLAVEPYRRVAC